MVKGVLMLYLLFSFLLFLFFSGLGLFLLLCCFFSLTRTRTFDDITTATKGEDTSIVGTDNRTIIISSIDIKHHLNWHQAFSISIITSDIIPLD